MADVITRFKLETTQFDSKLRDTSKALKDIAHQAELGGKDFDKFSDGHQARAGHRARTNTKDAVGSNEQPATPTAKASGRPCETSYQQRIGNQGRVAAEGGRWMATSDAFGKTGRHGCGRE